MQLGRFVATLQKKLAMFKEAAAGGSAGPSGVTKAASLASATDGSTTTTTKAASGPAPATTARAAAAAPRPVAAKTVVRRMAVATGTHPTPCNKCRKASVSCEVADKGTSCVRCFNRHAPCNLAIGRNVAGSKKAKRDGKKEAASGLQSGEMQVERQEVVRKVVMQGELKSLYQPVTSTLMTLSTGRHHNQ